MTEVDDKFQNVEAEGPFAYKPDRDMSITGHFNRFSDLDDQQKILLLRVRNGEDERCFIHLPDEEILVEHAKIGYFDPTKQRQWGGYTVRRIRTAPRPDPVPTEIAQDKSSPQRSSGLWPAEPDLRDSGALETGQKQGSAAPIIDAAHEQELQVARVAKIKAEDRIRRLEAELQALQERLTRTERSAVKPEVVTDLQRDKTRFQNDIYKLQNELKRVDGERQSLASALEKEREKKPAKITAAGEPSAAELRKLQRDLDQQRRECDEAKQILAHKERELDDREAKIEREAKIRRSQTPRAEETDDADRGEVVQAGFENPRVAPHDSEHVASERQEVIRACIIWFAALVLLGQFITLAWHAFHAVSDTTPTPLVQPNPAGTPAGG